MHRELALAVRSHGLASMATKAFIEYVRRWMSEEWSPQGASMQKKARQNSYMPKPTVRCIA